MTGTEYMSYMIDKFKEGEVHMRGKVCGWYFPRTSEFRPLMADAMKELLEAELVTQAHVDETLEASNTHQTKVLEEYAESQKEFWNNPDNHQAQLEQVAEMRDAFGSGGTVTNVFTGKEHKL